MSNRDMINIYADESHHLSNQAEYMVLGAVWCKKEAVRQFSDALSLLRQKHNISERREIKWTKVSPAKLDYYLELIDFFFKEEGLNFRAVVVPARKLDHAAFEQTADEFYYKMLYVMLLNVVRTRPADYKVYVDYKDAWSYFRSQKLAEYLSNKIGLTNRNFEAQPVRSYESDLLQIADLLIGAVAARNNEDTVSKAKKEVIERFEQHAVQSLRTQSPMTIEKVNIFHWNPQKLEA